MGRKFDTGPKVKSSGEGFVRSEVRLSRNARQRLGLRLSSTAIRSPT